MSCVVLPCQTLLDAPFVFRMQRSTIICLSGSLSAFGSPGDEQLAHVGSLASVVELILLNGF